MTEGVLPPSTAGETLKRQEVIHPGRVMEAVLRELGGAQLHPGQTSHHIDRGASGNSIDITTEISPEGEGIVTKRIAKHSTIVAVHESRRPVGKKSELVPSDTYGIKKGGTAIIVYIDGRGGYIGESGGRLKPGRVMVTTGLDTDDIKNRNADGIPQQELQSFAEDLGIPVK